MSAGRSGDPQHQRRYIAPRRYILLLQRLAAVALELQPSPDAVVGVKRSGLFPAVYLSHQLKLPMFTDSEVRSFPFPRLSQPLVVDTTAWGGASLRRVIARLEKLGIANPAVLVMFSRCEPPAAVPGLRYLELTDSIVHFWYETEKWPELGDAEAWLAGEDEEERNARS